VVAIDTSCRRHLAARVLLIISGRARKSGITEVVFLMHSFDFSYMDSIAERQRACPPTQLARLRSLCAFLREHANDFAVDTMGALAKRLPERAPATTPSPEVPTGNRLHRIGACSSKPTSA